MNKLIKAKVVGKRHTRFEDGKEVVYEPGATISVTESELQKFAGRLVVPGANVAPAPANAELAATNKQLEEKVAELTKVIDEMAAENEALVAKVAELEKGGKK